MARSFVRVLVTGSIALGCPIPAPYTEVLSPPVVGQLRGSDEVPIASARVVLSVVYLDSTCASPAQEAVTNEAGVFELPATGQTYHKVRWVTPLEQGPASYRVCVSAGQRLESAFVTYFRADSAPRDSLTCVEWAWEDRARATCSGVNKRRQHLTTGGRWQDDSSSGWFRLILTEGPDQVFRNGLPHFMPHAFVQWMEEVPGFRRVKHIAEVPLDPGIMKVESIELVQRRGVWHASLQGFAPRLIGLAGSSSLLFALGGPGDITAVEQHGK